MTRDGSATGRVTVTTLGRLAPRTVRSRTTAARRVFSAP